MLRTETLFVTAILYPFSSSSGKQIAVLITDWVRKGDWIRGKIKGKMHGLRN